MQKRAKHGRIRAKGRRPKAKTCRKTPGKSGLCRPPVAPAHLLFQSTKNCFRRLLDRMHLSMKDTRLFLCARFAPSFAPSLRLRLEKRSAAQIPLKHPSFASKLRLYSRKARLRRCHKEGAEDSSSCRELIAEGTVGTDPRGIPSAHVFSVADPLTVCICLQRTRLTWRILPSHQGMQ